MIPTSYLFKDLYQDRWGDPRNQHAVDLPTEVHYPSAFGGDLFSLIALSSTLRHRLNRRAVERNDRAEPSCA